MNEIIRKLMSRKLWLAIAGVATGISMVLGVDGGEITNVAGGVVALISCVAYMFVEGKVDAERVKNAVEGVQDALDAIQDGDSE